MIKIERIVKPIELDYNTNKRLIEELIKEYPFLKADISGRTVLGRGIFSFSLGSSKNSVLLTGGFCGNDRVTPLLLYMFIEDLCRSVKYKTNLCGVNISGALSQLGITIIPVVNPDSAEINLKGADGAKALRHYVSNISHFDSWESNARGVDIRKNFSFDFEKNKEKAYEKGIVSHSEKDYPGEYPESENETKSLTKLCRLRRFRQCMAVTPEGENVIVIDENENPETDIMSKILSQSCFYSLSESDGNTMSFPLWFSFEMKRPAFQLQAGKENCTYGDAAEIYERVKEAFTVFTLM